MDKMIYLIGGAPRCGKTTLARKISNELEISMLPADYIKSAVSNYIPKEELSSKLPVVNIRRENKSNDYLYSQYSAKEIVDFYYAEAETVWPAIKSIISYAIQDDHNIVIEGYQITPTLLHTITASELENIKTLFLYKKDKQLIAEALINSKTPSDWAKKKTKDHDTFYKISEMIKFFGDRTKKEAEQYGFPTFNMDTDFEDQLNKITENLNK